MPISTTTLRHLCGERSLRASDLAKLAGLSPSYLSEILSGRRQPSPVVTKALADALNVTVTDLSGPIVCPNCGYSLP
jgi:transcriptional regulator with XRE-family HTH domain